MYVTLVTWSFYPEDLSVIPQLVGEQAVCVVRFRVDEPTTLKRDP